MATMTQIDAASLKHSVKRTQDDTFPFGVFDAEGTEVDCFETLAEARESARELTEAAIEEAREAAREEYEEALESEREELAETLKGLIDNLDLDALKALAERLGA